MAVTVADAASGDLDAISDLWFRAQAARRPGSFVTIRDARALVEQRAAQRGASFVVALENEHMVGFAAAMPGREEDGRGKLAPGLIHLGMVAVEPHEWGRGIGKLLVERSCELGVQRGFRKMQLWTHADNVRAQRLYEGLGFTRSGRFKQDPRGETIVHYLRPLGAKFSRVS